MFDTTIGTWIGVVVGIIGLIAAYLFYRRSLVRAKLAFVSSSIQVTGRNSKFPPELKIFYKDKEVESVTQSNVIIWNAGNATIDRDRLVKNDPLRIVISPEGEILATSIVDITREVTAITGTIREGIPNEFEITFDFLDSGDGATINLTHTGGSTIHLIGTVRGIPSGVENFGRINFPPERSFFLQMLFITIVPVIATIFSFIYFIKLGLLPIVISWLFLSPFFLLGGWALFLIWRGRQRRPPLLLLKNNILDK